MFLQKEAWSPFRQRRTAVEKFRSDTIRYEPHAVRRQIVFHLQEEQSWKNRVVAVMFITMQNIAGLMTATNASCKPQALLFLQMKYQFASGPRCWFITEWCRT